ncbi:MAG: ABC transporter ATP-binding protein [Chloroflexota bacterium]
MHSSNELALQVKGLSVTFIESDGNLEVLDNLSFSIQPFSFVSMIGPSGGGKSTLLRVLSGLISPTNGEISFGTNSKENTKPKIGLVFQKANLMPWRTVLENITLPLQLTGIPSKNAKEQAMQMVEMVGLNGFENSLPHDLSGGMAQRVAIARSLVQDPDILLLDEPFGALDALTRERMGEELLRIWRTSHKTVLMVTHSIPEAIYLSDRVLVLTQRPAQICLDFPVDLARPRTEEIRYSSRFAELAHQLRQQLNIGQP